jgi:succinyl-CoA synthetase beta subunit
MLGYNLVTHQTTAEGVLVKNVMIAEAKDLALETYFAIVLDRTAAAPIIIASPNGGVDIEAVAAASPDSIFYEPITDIVEGPTQAQLANIAIKLGFDKDTRTLDHAVDQMRKLYELFIKVDAVQVEINPFGLTPENEVLCFDAKISFDDNAAFRQKEIFSNVDRSSDDPREVEALRHNLNYIGMDGNIGCLVNGAGLAMGTMDIIKMYGGEPANFLDVGGSANEAQIYAAFNLLSQDPKVKAILVNIFGGIMRCDIIAHGIVNAFRAGLVSKPLVVRLVGTNSELAKKMIDEAGLRIMVLEDLDEAASNAVELANQEMVKEMMQCQQ